MEYSMCRLTTFDNPYDPFTQFARVAKISEEMTEKEVSEEIERAIDEIIQYDFLNIYKKVCKK